MPKEYIITRSTQRRCDELGGRRESVRVGWQRDCWVQLATVLKAETEGALTEVSGDVDQGQFVDMDREAINRLIQVLRRARDQAFGADA